MPRPSPNRRYVPYLTISNTACVMFNAEAIRRYDLRRYTHVILRYDHSEGAIVGKFVRGKPRGVRAYKLTHGKRGDAQCRPRRFLEEARIRYHLIKTWSPRHYKLDVDEAGLFTVVVKRSQPKKPTQKGDDDAD